MAACCQYILQLGAAYFVNSVGAYRALHQENWYCHGVKGGQCVLSSSHFLGTCIEYIYYYRDGCEN